LACNLSLICRVPRELISPIDWSPARIVNGQETVVNKPLSLPLSPGQTWQLSYSEDHPRNKLHNPYVPEVKRWVKSTEEYFGSNGVRSESLVDELESCQVAK
jgi:hypothetical protein